MPAKTVAILGATSALGQAVARELLLANGASASGEGAAGPSMHVYLVARNELRMNEVAEDLKARGAEVSCIVCDLDDIAGHADLLHSLKDVEDYWFFYGSLPDQEQMQASWEATELAMRTNLLSPMSLLTGVANTLEEAERGSLVVVSSVAGDRGRQSNYVYGTAKGALSLFCQGLRNRLAAKSIPVMTVKPGFIDTPMTADIEKKPAVLWVGPERVAKDMVRAHARGRNVLYTPWFWQFIMLIIKSVPERVFKRLSL